MLPKESTALNVTVVAPIWNTAGASFATLTTPSPASTALALDKKEAIAIASFLSSASAVDAGDGVVSVANDAPAVFQIGATTVTFSAVDSLGNTGSSSAVVTVEDQTPPVITVEDATVAATDASGTLATDTDIAAFLDSATVEDNVDANVTVTNDAPDIFPIGQLGICLAHH